ncbi:MAG TPA: response regulator [Holophagaceae bacterium]|jgi:CheY-like chemotaxis protein|nr:response regulator [Holophagaceae bacterium]
MDEAGAGKLTVLLVDDDAVVQRFQSAALQEAGPFRILTANDGQEALELLRTTPVDAVVTDLQMPRMDGFRLVAELSARYPGLPVFVLTALPDLARLDPTITGESLRIHAKPPDYALLAADVRGLRTHPRGSVRGLPLPGLLQLLQWEGRTATVTVRSGTRVGHLYVEKGRLIQAETGEGQGLEAAISMCAWPVPSVEFVDTCRVPGAFSLSAEALQMELALRLDQDHA